MTDQGRHSIASIFAPLKVPTFRAIWTANIFSNFGSLVQAVGAAWLMTLIAASDSQVALVQASTTLPVMALALVAGALADNFDRRRILLASQIGMFTVSVGLAVATLLDLIGAWSLLAFTFLIGCGGAFMNPAWQASVRDFVGMDLLPRAVLLNGMGFNVIRSVAPAIGGLIVATAGAATAFVINAVSYLGLIVAVWRWEGPPEVQAVHRESLVAAIRAGFRYVAASPHLLRLYSRGFVFGLGGISVLALLPLITRDLLGGGSTTYGVLLGAFGVGAVAGGLASSRLAQRFVSETIVRLAFGAMALGLLLASVSPWLALTMLGVAISGSAWVLVLALFNTSVQMTTPRWVVGRALSMYQMSTFGGMALGAWVWGLWVEYFGLAVALQIAALTLLAGVTIGLRWPVPNRADMNLDPLGRWQEPALALDILPRSGPVLLSVEWLIDDADVPEFMRLMQERERIRRRDGARRWQLSRDLADTRRWVEQYEVPTWADYVRFHARTTHEDAKVSDRILAMHRGDAPPKVQRMLGRDPGDTRPGLAPESSA